MSKAQRWKQQQKDQKAAALAKAKKQDGPQISAPYKEKTLRERQAENKAALAKHQASMAKLKEFEAKLHPQPAGSVAQPQKETSALQDMFFDGSNLSKDLSRTTISGPAHGSKDTPPAGSRTVGGPAVGHERDTAIKPAATSH